MPHFSVLCKYTSFLMDHGIWDCVGFGGELSSSHTSIVATAAAVAVIFVIVDCTLCQIPKIKTN